MIQPNMPGVLRIKVQLHILGIFVVLTVLPILVSTAPILRIHGGGDSRIMNDALSVVHLRYRKEQTRTERSLRPHNEDETKNKIKRFHNLFGLKQTGYLDDDSANATKSSSFGVPCKEKQAIVRNRRFLNKGTKYDSIKYASHRVRRRIPDGNDKAGKKATPGQCQTKLDGAASIWGSTYFFRRGLVWKINDYDSKLISGYPKTISDEFSSRIPTPVDATLVWSDNIMYFLKDSRTVGYDIYSKSVKYDNTIEYDWPGIPNDIDASLTYRDDKVTYFFKGNQYWKFDDTFFHVANGYPRKISDDWPGIPNNIDAAFYSEWYKKTFFFKGTEYWEFDVKLNKAFARGSVANKWKNVCST